MDALSALIIAIVALISLDLAAVRWGVDSRPSIADDHQR
jgi:hypothetical protein